MEHRAIVTAVAIWLTAATMPAVSQQGQPSTTEILADLRTNNLSAEEVLGVTTAETVTFVSLENFSGGDLQDLEATLKNTEDGFAEVRSALERNQFLEAALRDEEIKIGQVVAITGSDSGEITMFVDRPQIR